MSFSGFFIKFGQLEHIIALHTKGQLYFGPINYFTKLEDNNLRGDNLEDAAEFKFFGNTKIFLKPVNAPDGEFKSLDALNVKMIGRHVEPFGNLFCLYAINAFHEPVNTKFTIDARVKEFGDYFMLILEPHEFIRRVVTALKREEYNYSHSLVEYLDFSNYSGKKTVFQKDIRYDYQKEFRIFIENKEAKPILIEVGDLSDISMVCAAKIVDTLEINLASKDGDKNTLQMNLTEPRRVTYVIRELKDFCLAIEGKQFHFQYLKRELESAYKVSVEDADFTLTVSDEEEWKFSEPVPEWIKIIEEKLSYAINETNRQKDPH